MKRIFTLIISMVFIGSAYAQSLQLVSMDDTVYCNPHAAGLDVWGKVKFQNVSSDTVMFKVRQNRDSSCALTVERQICVGTLCYAPFIFETPHSYPVAPGDIDESFSGHIRVPMTSVAEGCCPINYTFFDADDVNDSLQVTMWFCAMEGVGIEENDNGTLTVYPNPASDYLNVSFDGKGGEARFQVINLVGQVVADINLTESTQGLDLTDLDAGVYFYTLMVDGKPTETKRLIINK